MMISRAEAIELDQVNGDELLKVRQQAAQLRDDFWGTCLTYSRKVFVPLTNMCRDSCGYCTFVKKPGTPEARIMTPDQVLDVVRQGEKMHCKEVLFSLGEKPELKHQQARDQLNYLGFLTMPDYIHAMCKLVIANTGMLPHVNAGTLTEPEMVMLKEVSASMGMMLESVSRGLIAKGMAHYACPDKVPVQRLRTLDRAGKLQIPFTTGILIGIGETWADRVDSLIAINESYLKYGHIQEVIIQNFCAKPGTAMALHPEPSEQDMLKTLAMARMLLHPAISLQAPPNLQDRYAAYIGSGINDWGGISPLTIDYINPEKAWPQINQLERTTAECGYQLKERLAVYPSFQQPGTSYLHPAMADRVASLSEAPLINTVFQKRPESVYAQ